MSLLPFTSDHRMQQNIKRPKLRDVIADRVKGYIVAEDLRPGDQLPTETELAEMFGVSRLSLREATKSLGFLGIIDAKPGRGLTVGQLDMDRVTEYLGFHTALHNVSPKVLIDTRTIIEAGVLPAVAAQMQLDPAIYDRLTKINQQLSQTKDLERFIELDVALHRGLIEASGLTPLLAFSDFLTIFFIRFRKSVRQAEWGPGIESHQRILDNLRDGNIAAADAEVRAHIQSHLKWIERSEVSQPKTKAGGQ